MVEDVRELGATFACKDGGYLSGRAGDVHDGALSKVAAADAKVAGRRGSRKVVPVLWNSEMSQSRIEAQRWQVWRTMWTSEMCTHCTGVRREMPVELAVGVDVELGFPA